MNRKQALAAIFDTHNFYTVAGGHAIIAAFGLDPAKFAPESQLANTGNPKGLTVPGKGHGEVVEGYSSFSLVPALAMALGVDMASVPQFYGRGSQQRAYATAIVAHLEKQKIQKRAAGLRIAK